MSSVIIIGTGPAGMSAALHTAQCGIDTILIGLNNSTLVNSVQTVFGYNTAISGKILIDNTRSRLKDLGVEIITDEVIGFSYTGKLHVKTKSADYSTDSLIITTGPPSPLPDLDNLSAFIGKGVHHCAACDAFFYRDRHPVVLGNGEYALYEANQLLTFAASATILTNGEPVNVKIPDHITVIEKKIEGFFGHETIEGVLFEDDSSLLFAGLFLAVGIANGSDLARKLGVMSENQLIQVNNQLGTNLPGVYAAGGCTNAEMTLSKAIYEGEKAGMEAAKFLSAKAHKNS
ncbi:NAD(P)/FAD-dependent oxidoreductase [Eubacteriaceae bacterium ES3]|nr:NAD(P)/FAD-dependent oxidoreductase [Eubacteriaceae bacterium ES3]